MSMGPSKYDPRMGDESGDEGPSPSPVRRHASHRHVRLDTHPTLEEYNPADKERQSPIASEGSSDSETTKKADSTKSRQSVGAFILAHSPVNLQWIPDNWSWSRMKPLIRCAIMAWLSVLFFVIKRLEILLGQVGDIPLFS